MEDSREIVNTAELETLRSMSGLTTEELQYIQKESAEFLGYLTIKELRSAAERVVDLYFKAENSTYGCDYGFTKRCVEPFAKSLLETLLNQDDEEEAERIAYRTVKGAAVAVGFKRTYLDSVGMAQNCTFPDYLGQNDQ